MVTGNFYYLKDSYYNKFPNCNLIGNKTDDSDEKHDRGIKIILTDLDIILQSILSGKEN